ncbi:hypothetical protein NM208_g9711 [Fusarium decemcellulare]|uniref:Uncharacterized protein n=1 Tax=Fusarium decemcellulare TaxID=57161 RepID=A0ACC1S0P6_9HYPO|nr:hypothetical protein NM208_g9711 [Fusarium decemcellulare]
MPLKRKSRNTEPDSIKAAKTSTTSTPGSSRQSDTDYDVDDYLSASQKAIEEESETEEDDLVTSWAVGQSRALKQFFGSRDFSNLPLKQDPQTRPLWIDPDKGVIILEKFSPLAEQATDFLITIAEPRSRPTFVHEYALTSHSLYAAVSSGLTPEEIIMTLDRFLKTQLPTPGTEDFIKSCTKSYEKVKLVLRNNRYFIESVDQKVLKKLLNDETISECLVRNLNEITTLCATVTKGIVIPGTEDAAIVQEATLPQYTGEKPFETDADARIHAALIDGDNGDEEAVHSFEVPDSTVQKVQKRCLDLGYPILEEYDFRCDSRNEDLDIDLRPNTHIRPHQEKSLSKMFGNGRAKSGIVVLPCGAGKTLVGITAACTIKKGTIVLCTNTVSAIQWRREFLKFTSSTGIIVTTYYMVTDNRERSTKSKQMMDFLKSREWGLMLLDEVHVVPANVFRRVIASIKSHSKLGLTATLLREDDKISHLNFLIGPKLYEANWMELSEQGHIAKVQCAEVWCPMPLEFYKSYMGATSRMKRTLCAVNPSKFQACQYLINYHEGRGDKIIVFSDDLYSLRLYALMLGKAFLFGGTTQEERRDILENFQHNPPINTLFLSKIGDTSLDLPEATCLIQISSHFGSRRQEAQRLGRILRAKRRNDVGFNAFFYSLVSKDTQEMFYSSKRQAFLVDQGYAFKVITHLAGMDEMADLWFATEAKRQELLQQTLKENDESLEGNSKTGQKVAGHGRKGQRNSKKMTTEQKKVADGKKNARNPFFKNVGREQERRKKFIKDQRKGLGLE